MRTDPPSSLPIEPKQNPADTAAADPADDPPVIRSRSQGLWAGPKQPVVPVPAKAISSRLSLPKKTAPAAFSRRVISASSAGTRSWKTRADAVVRMLAVSMLSFNAIGIPARDPAPSPMVLCRSHVRDWASAESASTVMNVLRCASNAAIRARQSFVSSSEEICRLASAAAASPKLHASRSDAAAARSICTAATAAPASQARRVTRFSIPISLHGTGDPCA